MPSNVTGGVASLPAQMILEGSGKLTAKPKTFQNRIPIHDLPLGHHQDFNPQFDFQSLLRLEAKSDSNLLVLEVPPISGGPNISWSAYLSNQYVVLAPLTIVSGITAKMGLQNHRSTPFLGDFIGWIVPQIYSQACQVGPAYQDVVVGVLKF